MRCAYCGYAKRKKGELISSQLYIPLPVEEIREGYVEFLSRYSWEWFTTHTFREEVHPERADKLFAVWVSKINRQLYGTRWCKHGKGLFGAKAIELQERGVIHFHALIGGDRLQEIHRLTQMDVWNELAGYARILPPKSHDAVVSYVSKYVVKGGEIDFFGPFPFVPTLDVK